MGGSSDGDSGGGGNWDINAIAEEQAAAKASAPSAPSSGYHQEAFGTTPSRSGRSSAKEAETYGGYVGGGQQGATYSTGGGTSVSSGSAGGGGGGSAHDSGNYSGGGGDWGGGGGGSWDYNNSAPANSNSNDYSGALGNSGYAAPATPAGDPTQPQGATHGSGGEQPGALGGLGGLTGAGEGNQPGALAGNPDDQISGGSGKGSMFGNAENDAPKKLLVLYVWPLSDCYYCSFSAPKLGNCNSLAV